MEAELCLSKAWHLVGRYSLAVLEMLLLAMLMGLVDRYIL